MSNQPQQIIEDNWRTVKDDVAEACHQAGRDPDSVRIVGVSKYVGPELTALLVQAGCQVVGENRPQSLWNKVQWFESQATPIPVRWHMIGHLQRNKIRRTLPHINCLHSLDSVRLASALQAEASRAGRQLTVLVEVNVTQDPSKTGLPPEQVRQLLAQADEFSSLKFSGLMAMSTQAASPPQARQEFESVRNMQLALSEEFPELDLPELSMGMSGDFCEAIQAGATLVRIGSSLWRGLLDR